MSYFVFVTGGVMSSIGKGISSASIGTLLQSNGFSVRIKKLEAYLNVDPGMMSPEIHGETFVTGDGCEADLDFGHYERFTNIECTRDDLLTTGKIYKNILKKEENNEYGGSDIQVIPHVTDEIKSFITREDGQTDFLIFEIGGTVGDIESLPYIEAIRQLKLEMPVGRTVSVHLSYLPYIKSENELKTKLTQHSVKTLQSLGIQPDIILCRAERKVNDPIKLKLSKFCNVKIENVIEAVDAKNIYMIPCMFYDSGLDRRILAHFGIQPKDKTDIIQKWRNIESAILSNSKTKVRVAVMGKHTKSKDVHISLSEAISHAGFVNDVDAEIEWIEDNSSITRLKGGFDGIIVTGEFEPACCKFQVEAVECARQQRTPFLGICAGFHAAVVDEFGDGSVIKLSKDRIMGNHEVVIKENTLAHKIYGTNKVVERHSNRYITDSNSNLFSGFLIEDIPDIFERVDHPFFIAIQAHPEFKSRPFLEHPLFREFIGACKMLNKQHEIQ